MWCQCNYPSYPNTARYTYLTLLNQVLFTVNFCSYTVYTSSDVKWRQVTKVSALLECRFWRDAQGLHRLLAEPQRRIDRWNTWNSLCTMWKMCEKHVKYDALEMHRDVLACYSLRQSEIWVDQDDQRWRIVDGKLKNGACKASIPPAQYPQGQSKKEHFCDKMIGKIEKVKANTSNLRQPTSLKNSNGPLCACPHGRPRSNLSGENKLNLQWLQYFKMF